MHRDYFTDHHADKHLRECVTPYATDTERQWMIRMLRSPLYQCDTPWFIQQLKDMEGFEYHRANHLYELYVQAGVVAPMASLQYWRRGVNSNVRIISHTQTYDPDTGGVTIYKSFGPIVNTVLGHFVRGLPAHVAVPYLLISMKTPFEITLFNELPVATRARCSAQIWCEILTHIVPKMSGRTMMCATLEPVLAKIDEEHEDEPGSVWWVPGVREHLLSTLKSLQLVYRNAAKERMEPLREELMMTAWHPKRVERWLEAGIECEDM